MPFLDMFGISDAPSVLQHRTRSLPQMRFIDSSPQAFLLNPMNKPLSGIMPWTHVDCFMIFKYHYIYIYIYYIYILHIYIYYISIYILHTYYVLHTYIIYGGLYYINTIFVPYICHTCHGPRTEGSLGRFGEGRSLGALDLHLGAWLVAAPVEALKNLMNQETTQGSHGY